MRLDLLDSFDERVQANPDAVAVEAPDVAITYRALSRHADMVARALLDAGRGPGDRVAAWTGDRAALIGVMLGVLRAGAVFAPLEHDAPDERLRQRLRQLRPQALVHDATATDAARGHIVAAGLAECVCVAVPDNDGVIPEGSAPILRRDATAPGYVYFTSGSTGRPKGIVGTLTGLADRVAWEIDTFGVEPGTRVSQLIAPTFDPWFRDVFVPLCAGGTIVVPPKPPAALEAEKLVLWLHDARIELMHCGPSLMSALVSAPARIRRLPALRTVLTSGEVLHVSLAKRWRRRFGVDVELVNLYGATEATMVQFFHRVEASDTTRAFIPVGCPLPGVKVRLVDASGTICAPGDVGEILVGGGSLSLGYLDDEAQTRSAFVRVPRDGEIYYRTGDLGIEFQAGCYRLLGRSDDQVKIRGVRVEPREVEDALIGYPLIASCAVVARPDRNGETSLVAYVVPETEYPPAVPDMRVYLRERFPPQYLPAKFVLLKALPLSSNGKIDRARLPDPEPAFNTVASVAPPPGDALEAALAARWSEILGLPAVGVDDDFFELGGHSLSAMRLLSVLSAEGVGELSVRDVLDNPTIAAQAALLRARRGEHPREAKDGEVDIASAAHDRAHPAMVGFHCPREKSSVFGRRRCNLVMVLGTDDDRETFERAAAMVGELDPAIHVRVVADTQGWERGLPRRPTLVFSPALLRHTPAIPAHVCCGLPLAKSEEYRFLERAGIAVPRWTTLEEGKDPDLSPFGRYVVRKPDYGAKGAEIRIVRRDRVRWKPVVTSAAGPSPRLLVQEFVYTGRWPTSYRVNTLFGRVLYSLVVTGNRARPPLEGPEDFDARGSGGQSVSIVSNARDSTAAACMDDEIIAFGERAARVFPDVPLLGVDILRNAATGQLAVAEVNSLGHNWNFGPAFAAAFGVDVERQFDGLRKAAYILAEETQLRAGMTPRT